MLTPLSEHAAPPNCGGAQKVALWRVHRCLPLVAELLDELRHLRKCSEYRTENATLKPVKNGACINVARSEGRWGGPANDKNSLSLDEEL